LAFGAKVTYIETSWNESRRIAMFSFGSRLAGALLVLMWAATAHAATLRIGSWDHASRDMLSLTSEAVLARAYAELKQPVEFVDLPIRRAMTMLLAEELDGNVYRVAELAAQQPTLYRVETPINMPEVSVYALDSRARPANWSQLGDLRVGYLRGVLLIERNLTSTVRRVEANSQADMFRMLQRNMIDVALAVEPAQSPPHPTAVASGIQRLDSVLAQTPLHHYLLARHRDIGVRLNTVLQRMQVSGELDAIRARVLRQLH